MMNASEKMVVPYSIPLPLVQRQTYQAVQPLTDTASAPTPWDQHIKEALARQSAYFETSLGVWTFVLQHGYRRATLERKDLAQRIGALEVDKLSNSGVQSIETPGLD